MAKVSIVKEAIMICRDANVSLFIWGLHGLGKSSIVAQVAADNKWGNINERLSQIEASELRGLPDKKDGRTVYLPPAKLPMADLNWEEAQEMLKKEKDETKMHELAELLQPRLREGILFLDEANRAQDDVLQATFELVLDRKVGQYVLPPKWSVVCAGNFNEGYMTNSFTDAAFLDRFCHIILSAGESTLDEWVTYMAGAHGEEAASVIEFASQNMKHLDPQIKAELGFPIGPSRRSWEAVMRVQKVCQSGKYSEEAKTEVIAGLVGRDLAMSYVRYECPVKPREIIELGVDKVSPKLKGLTRNQMTGLVWGLVSFVKPHNTEDKQAGCALDFAEWMVKNLKEKDLVVAFLHALVTDEGDKRGNDIKAAAISNPKIAALLASAAAKTKKGGDKSFLSRLNERKELQKLVSDVAWGVN